VEDSLKPQEIQMGLVFHRRLAIPLWAIALFMVAFTVPPPATLLLMPPTTLFVIAVIGIAMIIFAMRGMGPWLSACRAVVCDAPSRYRRKTSVAITMAAGMRTRTLHEPNASTASDTLELVRIDDHGGWQRARPPA
jgi:hypothetical protein